jgi:hypothetical protein
MTKDKAYECVTWSRFMGKYTAKIKIELKHLTLILLTWGIWWAPNNASRWHMGINLAFEGLGKLITELSVFSLQLISRHKNPPSIFLCHRWFQYSTVSCCAYNIVWYYICLYVHTFPSVSWFVRWSRHISFSNQISICITNFMCATLRLILSFWT